VGCAAPNIRGVYAYLCRGLEVVVLGRQASFFKCGNEMSVKDVAGLCDRTYSFAAKDKRWGRRHNITKSCFETSSCPRGGGKTHARPFTTNRCRRDRHAIIAAYRYSCPLNLLDRTTIVAVTKTTTKLSVCRSTPKPFSLRWKRTVTPLLDDEKPRASSNWAQQHRAAMALPERCRRSRQPHVTPGAPPSARSSPRAPDDDSRRRPPVSHAASSARDDRVPPQHDRREYKLKIGTFGHFGDRLTCTPERFPH